MYEGFKEIIIPRTDLDNLKKEVETLTQWVELQLIELKKEMSKLKKEQLKQQQQIKDLGEEQKHQKEVLEHHEKKIADLEHQGTKKPPSEEGMIYIYVI